MFCKIEMKKRSRISFPRSPNYDLDLGIYLKWVLNRCNNCSLVSNFKITFVTIFTTNFRL